MARFRITVEYNGAAYCGWQRQKNGRAVQEVLEDALATVLQQPVTLTGSGRTDAGVHAMGQVAHFDADTALMPDKILLAANSMLPEDVRIVAAEEAAPDFHAQYGAKRKTYQYRTYVSHVLHPLKAPFAERIQPPLHIEKMREGAALLVGVHDFAAFSSADRTVKTTVREIFRLDICAAGEDIIFEVEGNGFLYNMVRILVGTLVYLGKGKISLSDIETMLKTGDRTLGGKTYPAKGLSLKRVDYQ